MSDIWHKGGCHCGAVEFEVRAPQNVTVYECNCSLCQMLGFTHLITPKTHFRLLKGEDALTEYRFNTKTARHFFCSHCGVKGFYIPRSNPDGYSVNMRVLDKSGFDNITIEPFDGQNWEQHAHKLESLSKG